MLKAWRSWHSANVGAQRQLMAMRRVVLSRCGQALRSWRDACDAAAASERRLRRGLAAISPEGRAMRLAWNGWSAAAEQWSCIRAAVVALRRRGERAAFGAWLYALDARAAHQDVLRRSCSALRHRVLRAVLQPTKRDRMSRRAGTLTLRWMF